MEEPHVLPSSVLILPHSKETPSAAATSCEVFPHDPAFPLAGMPLQRPLPQGFKDGMIYMAEDALAVDVTVIHRPTAYDPIELCGQLPRRDSLCSFDNFPNVFQNVWIFLRDGLTSNFPSLYLRKFCPRKSKPSSMCVTLVFSAESSRPRARRNSSTSGFTSCSSSSFVLPVMMKSSA